MKARLIFGIALIVFGFVESASSAKAPPYYIDLFSFEPGRDCSKGFFPTSYCEATLKKDWERSDLQYVKRLLGPLLVSPQLQFFTSLLASNKFTTFYRYKYGAQKINDSLYVRQPKFAAWVNWTDRSINFADKFFEIDEIYDPISGYRIKRMIFIHELSHAIDYKSQFSLNPTFINLTGFRMMSDGRWVLRGVDPDEHRDVVQKWLELNKQGREMEGYRLMREFANSHGFPTAHGMTNPQELFADILAHIYVDSSIETYLDTDIRQWYRRILQL